MVKEAAAVSSQKTHVVKLQDYLVLAFLKFDNPSSLGPEEFLEYRFIFAAVTAGYNFQHSKHCR